MEEEGGPRLSKRFSEKGGEVDLKTKAGTAWSHNFLNQKPWHPLSYPNQRRKWIAEQTFAEKERRAQEVAREYAQEQDFFRQTALVSKKEKDKMEMMRAVSFMYIRPPGYNAESAKAAEVADEHPKEDQGESDPSVGASSSKQLDSLPAPGEKKKSRPKDVFGRHLPTGEQFEALKNAPKLETGVHGRAKPFGIEIRNVKCVRCGNFGHQSGDRECPLKDVIMPNEESRLKRDDPLTAIIAQTDAAEPLKWELKQNSPPHGGFNFDDPNQQIVAEDIFDEYGGFLTGDVPDLLANFSSGNPKKKKTSKRKKKKQLSPSSAESSDGEENALLSVDDRKKSSKKRKHKRQLSPSTSEGSDDEKSRTYSKSDKVKRSKKQNQKQSRKHYSDPSTSEDDHDRHSKMSSKCLDQFDSNGRQKSRHHHHQSSDNDFDWYQKSRSSHHQSSDNDYDRHQKSRSSHHQSSDNDYDRHQKSRSSHHQSSDNDFDRHQKSRSSHRQSSDNDFDRHQKSRSSCRRTEADSSDHSDHSGHKSTHWRHRHRQRTARSSSPDHSPAHEHHHHRRR